MEILNKAELTYAIKIQLNVTLLQAWILLNSCY